MGFKSGYSAISALKTFCTCLSKKVRLVHMSSYGLLLIIIIIIITLFQEDNIFSTAASLTYGHPLTDVDIVLKK